MWEKVQETVAFIQSKIQHKPTIGIVLGSGLGNLINDMEIEIAIPYSEIINFPIATVKGHGTNLIFGKIGNQQVVAMQGRFHYYEGYDMKEVTFPIRVMKYLGVENLIVSNASGGVNPNFKVGDIMFIKDHINMFPEHPLRGKNDERFGPRFLNMSEPYNLEILKTAQQLAADLNISVHTGVYYGLTGPTFETLSEYKMIRSVGADCVGMSTVPEVIVARHMDMKCFGVSVISDMGDEDSIHTISHDEVLEAVNAAEPKLRRLIKELILKL